MNALKKIPPPLQLSILALVTLAMVFATIKFVKAQETGWNDGDIGLASAPGSTRFDNGSYVLSSTGPDMWFGADSLHFAYQTLGTNGQLVARVTGVQGFDGFAKAGVTIRETLNPGARNAMMLLTSSNGTFFQSRAVQWQFTTQTAGVTNVGAPYWLKIVRSGDWVGGYDSADGANWRLVDWQMFNGLAPQVYIGLGVSAHNHQGVLATASFDSVSTGPADLLQVALPLEGSGDGLRASYYDNRDLFGTPVINRVERQVAFNYNEVLNGMRTNGQSFSDCCKALLGKSKAHEFGVCWLAEVQPQFTEPYTFYTRTDDGARVWLNEQLIIDDWHSHSANRTVASAPTNLVAGQRYLLRVEYFQNKVNAQAYLEWSSPSTSIRVIPQSQLYSQPTDSDGNGLPDLWEQHYFGRIGVDPNADPDGDGLSNLQEYKQHSDPTNPQTQGVPDTWGDGDIGPGNFPGSATFSNGVFTVSSTAKDIWDEADQCHYVYEPLGTNTQFVARITGYLCTNKYLKAGVMLRESLDADSRNAMMLLTPSHKLRFQWREVTGKSTEETTSTSEPAAPCWLKIVRSEDWIGGYASPDGATWTLVDWAQFKGLGPQVYVGLAVAAHDGNNPSGNPGVAQFDNVSTAPADPSEVVNVPEGNGDGLLGSYRSDSLLYLAGLKTRVDKVIDFNWPHQPPLELNPDSYGVAFSGEIEAQLTGPHTFSVQTRREDWVRLWINEQLVVDQWRTVHPDGDFTGTPINLVAGQHYLIRVEMFNNLGHGKISLHWSGPSMSERVVPQSQLYSQPLMDSSGNGLPVLWEQIYFGQTGVDPNADPDGDGLSNVQEYTYHTNPNKADTDSDGLPDAWEIAHGLDPQYPDANLDYDNSGLSNLQDYLLGLNPLNPDQNNDGLPDAFEEQYLGTGTNFTCTNQITVAALINGAQGSNYLGSWAIDGNDVYCLGRRGGLDFNFTSATADKFVLNIIGTQNQRNPLQTSFKLLLSADGQDLGASTLNAGYGTNGTAEVVLPYLQAGAHKLHVFWDGYASYSSLRIKQVKLLSVSGGTNQNGIKNWVAKMVADESGLDNSNSTISSYTSPICLEGRDPYPLMMSMTNRDTNALSATATTDGRWYVNIPLKASSQTAIQASYQNGALTLNRTLQWLPLNVLTATNPLTVRKGDSLLFNAAATNDGGGAIQITVGTNEVTGNANPGASYKFTSPGTTSVAWTYSPTAGAPQSGSLTVDVVDQHLPNVQPAAWTWMPRNLNLANLAPEAVLQADSRLTCAIAATNSNGAVTLALGTEVNVPLSILARLGEGGPIMDSTQVQAFDVWSGNQAYTKIIQVYPDGSQLVEMLVISSPVNTNVTFVLQPIVGGVTFDDGTISKTLTATNFDALGQCPVRFIRPASATTSVCNSIKAYQANTQIGYRH